MAIWRVLWEKQVHCSCMVRCKILIWNFTSLICLIFYFILTLKNLTSPILCLHLPLLISGEKVTTLGGRTINLEFTSHGSGNSDRRKEEKPSSLQKLKVWLNKIRDPVWLFGLYACVCENESSAMIQRWRLKHGKPWREIP